MGTFHLLAIILQDNESVLMNTILNYALQHGYSKYTSTLVEAWRLSISGLTDAITRYIAANPNNIPDITVDSNYRDDAVASFGVIEAQRHRSRGIDLGMFLGLFKYYRDSYIDLINDQVQQSEKRSIFKKYLLRCFDRIELSFCMEWAATSDDMKISELQTKNVLLANEKNKYLTLFESFLSPLILLKNNHIENMNMAGIQLLEPHEGTGFFYYNVNDGNQPDDTKSSNIIKYKDRDILEIFPWMASSLAVFDKYNATYNQFTTQVFNASSRAHEDYCVTIFPMRDYSQNFPGKIILFENISEKKLADIQLHESEDKYRTLVETMNEGILVLNKNLIVTYINEKVSALLGYPKNEIIGQDFVKFLHAESKHDFIEQQKLRSEGVSDSHEFVVVNKNGEKVFILSSPTPITDNSQNYSGSYEVLTNISNIKLIEMQLIHSQKMETIGVMASGIAHEINTPLQYVMGNTNFVKENLDQLITVMIDMRKKMETITCANIKETLHSIDKTVNDLDIDFITEEIPLAINGCMEGLDRISTIVTSVKRFSHPDSDSFKAINVNKEIANTITISKNEWKSIALLTSEFGENIPSLHCIPSDFNQVMLNLIINASHAIEERYGSLNCNGLIHIKTLYENHNIVVSVTDNGSGIKGSIQKKIFNPFFTTKDVGKGTGMGLSIVLKIIEKHKAKIWFETKEGEGTTFFVEFPLHHESNEQSEQR